MKTKHTYLLTFLFIFLFSNQGYSQRRIAVYVQNASSTTNVQWTKMTHLVHAFFNPMDNTGDMTNASGVPTNSPNAWFITANFTTMVANARAANPAIKIIICTGGAPAPGDMGITTRLNTILASSAARTAMADDLAAFIQQYNLDGWDFDLEHPVSVAEKANHELFLSMMRTRLDALESTMCKELEISIALNGETDHFVVNPTGADYVNPTVDPYVDFYHLMTYDASYGAHRAVTTAWPVNHSPLIHAQEAVRDFSSPPFNWSKSKMVIGIPFYGRNSGGTTSNYSAINPSPGNSTAYNADITSGFNYNGCPTIQNKVTFAKTEGLAGVLVWEGSQDLNNSTGFSLASCLYTAMGAPAAWEKTCCDKPNLGNDLLTCGNSFPITLNANTTATGSPTYAWNKIAPTSSVVNASGSVTQAVSSAGTYVVTRTSGTCSRTDTIVITTATALPTPSLGADRTLCQIPYILKPFNASSFPPATTFQWQKAGTNISGETNSTLYASGPATYTLVATLAGCTSSSDDIIVSASSISPIDACRTSAGTLNLGITGGTGPYTWYSSDLPGNTVVGTGTTFTTPVLPLPSTTYYYVEDAGAITNVTVGEAGPYTGFGNNVTDPATYTGISMEFDVKNPVNIQSVDLYPMGGATYPFSFAVEIFNDNNTVVYSGPTNTLAVWPGLNVAVTMTLNAHLPIGKYRMRAVKSGGTNIPGFFHHNTSAFPYGSAQDLTITREIFTAQYGPFFRWVIGDYNGCPRVPVRAEVAASCSGIYSLPVDMLYFNADKNGSDVLLDWATAAEKNNDYFSIERSLDGIHFLPIGRVEGNGTNLFQHNYAYTDANAPKEIMYYRLAQYDFDGVVSYSSIKIINNKDGIVLSVAPNPFFSTTSVVVKGAKGLVQLRVYDLQGKLVQSFAKEASEEIQIGNGLGAGLYLVEVAGETFVKQYKIVKE